MCPEPAPCRSFLFIINDLLRQVSILVNDCFASFSFSCCASHKMNDMNIIIQCRCTGMPLDKISVKGFKLIGVPAAKPEYLLFSHLG